jgi:flagellin FlaB
MFEFINDEEARGQVGIGTLIVFIAMVLVAAIAAGVLINTAGFLQTQAEETGQDSTDQVANNINVIGTIGEIDSLADDDGNIDLVRLTVQRSAGSGDIDLSGLSIQYVGPDSFANLVHTSQDEDDASDPDTPTYGVEAVTASTSSDPVMTKASDRYQIVIPLQAGTTSNGVTIGLPDDQTIDNSGSTGLKDLDESQSVELTITTESGAQRYVTLQAPDSFVNKDTVQL